MTGAYSRYIFIANTDGAILIFFSRQNQTPRITFTPVYVICRPIRLLQCSIVLTVLTFVLFSCASQKKVYKSSPLYSDTDMAAGTKAILPAKVSSDYVPGAYVPRLKENVRGPRASFSDEMRYFMEIALGSEYGLGDFTVKKWVDDIRVELIGNPTVADLETVRQVIADLNGLIGTQVNMRLVNANGNVKMHFIPHNNFYKYEPNGIVFYGGFFWGWWNYAGEITMARVVIGSDRIEQGHRNHLIREELTQILGLMNDSDRYEQSIFYQKHTVTDRYSAMDESVIRMLYSNAVTAGMTDFKIKAVLSEMARHRNNVTVAEGRQAEQ